MQQQQHAYSRPVKQGHVPPKIISTEAIGDAIIVNELTTEMSMERRMQKAEDQGIGEKPKRGGRRSSPQ